MHILWQIWKSKVANLQHDKDLVKLKSLVYNASPFKLLVILENFFFKLKTNKCRLGLKIIAIPDLFQAYNWILLRSPNTCGKSFLLHKYIRNYILNGIYFRTKIIIQGWPSKQNQSFSPCNVESWSYTSCWKEKKDLGRIFNFKIKYNF